MKKMIFSAILIAASGFAHAQLSKKFGREAQALMEAKEKQFQGKLIEEDEESVTYETTLKLTGFDVKYLLSRDEIAVLATYRKKGDEKTMDAIAKQLAEIPYVVLDSKEKPALIRKGRLEDIDIIRKIEVRKSETGQVLLTIRLDKDAAVRCRFEK